MLEKGVSLDYGFRDTKRIAVLEGETKEKSTPSDQDREINGEIEDSSEIVNIVTKPRIKVLSTWRGSYLKEVQEGFNRAIVRIQRNNLEEVAILWIYATLYEVCSGLS